ncbi:MAG: transcription-repair coupling factor, partial [Flavobacteriales bacterium]|nr:transcription-repair coupling factor [Flavobacteriales bacterium]
AAYFLNDLEALATKEEGDKRKDESPFLFFPAPSRSPYDPEGQQDGDRVTRTEVLEELMRGRRNMVLVTYAEALVPLVVGREKMRRNTLTIRRGEELPLDTLMEWLQGTGFHITDFVYEPGQFSIRGGIVDIFSYGSDRPYRLELFGDQVESVRRFDPHDQLSVERLADAVIVPDLQDEDAADQQTFFAQLPDDAVVWVNSTEAIADAASSALEHLQAAHERLPDREAHAKPEHLIATPDQLLGELERFRLVQWTSKEVPPTDPRFNFQLSAFPFSTRPQPAFAKDFQALSTDLHTKQAEGFTNIIACSNAKQSERLYTIFQDMEHEVCFTPMVLGLHEGFIDPLRKLVLYTDHQIFERYHRFRLKEGFRRNSQALTLKELTQLKPGDLVVHIDHGIGVFSGLEKLDVNGKQQEAIRLLYRDNDILYVSIHSLHRVSRYTAQEGVQPKVNKLGTAAWKNLKERTKKKIKELAFDLIKLYAERKAKPGHAYPPDNYLQHELEASFIYEDTPDQEKATLDVKKDL